MHAPSPQAVPVGPRDRARVIDFANRSSVNRSALAVLFASAGVDTAGRPNASQAPLGRIIDTRTRFFEPFVTVVFRPSYVIYAFANRKTPVQPLRARPGSGRPRSGRPAQSTVRFFFHKVHFRRGRSEDEIILRFAGPRFYGAK